jgi:hypothetical protein
MYASSWDISEILSFLYFVLMKFWNKINKRWLWNQDCTIIHPFCTQTSIFTKFLHFLLKTQYCYIFGILYVAELIVLTLLFSGDLRKSLTIDDVTQNYWRFSIHGRFEKVNRLGFCGEGGCDLFWNWLSGERFTHRRLQ